MRSGLLIAAMALLVTTTTSAQAQDNATIYGSQLMTQQERIEYRNQMRALKTQEERNAFRLEHHQKMQERAQARGLKLPDEAPAAGGGAGPGRAGGGRGNGPGQGMGQGRGQNRP